MIIISTVKKSGVPANALVIPEGYGLPRLIEMFPQSATVTEIPFEIIGKPTLANQSFNGFNYLEHLPAVDFSQCTKFSKMVESCYSLKEIDLSTAKPENLVASSWWDGLGVTAAESIINMPVSETFTATNTYYNTFYGCTSLKDISFNGKIGANIDFSQCAFSSATPLLNIAFALSETNTATVTFKTGSSVSTILSNAHCRLNESGDGLETCNAGDDGDLGTISQYITGKGWTVAFA